MIAGITGAILMFGWVFGFKLGWTLMDSWLERRRIARESAMKNITPRKER